MTEKHTYTNRLIHQKSPYLLQHAHNPVDWYPWGEEAFNAAQMQDRPIFLSIGYATCHWCHVMEHESFENLEVAQLMNETFINIKVDREELPEIDGLYMEFAQSMMAGTAGWPLNVILTPALLPFFASTYLPPSNAHGLMGLTELVLRIREVWNSEEREHIVEQSEKILEVFTQSIHVQGDELPDHAIIDDTADLLFKLADPIYGGMRGTPKFPIGYQNNFFLRYFCVKKESRALYIVEKTLDMMHRGGIYDQLGGGFSRYSVDEKWMVPHFEKMLYDNALLAHSYLEAWQVTKKDFYRHICEEVLRYVLRDMTDVGGGFYSAEDADSEGHEGYFYTWSYEEVVNVLGSGEAALFCQFYDITPEGNFEGRNILHTPQSIEQFAEKNASDPVDLKERFASQRAILWKVREKRPHPFKDDKILSSWNGLMITALANAGSAFSSEEYLKAAERAATFVDQKMAPGGRLLRRWREGEAFFNAGLEDYAYLIRGYLSLFEAGCGTQWLESAIKFSKILEDEFKASEGAFYQTDGKDTSVIMRKCLFSDGAEPSGNAIHCENLLKLYQITMNDMYLKQAEDIFKAVKMFMDNYPPGYCYHIMNLMKYYDKNAPTAIIAFNDKTDWHGELRHEIFSNLSPHRAVVWKRYDDSKLISIVPGLKDYIPQEGKTTLYLCRQGVCQSPIQDLNEMKIALNA